MKKILLCLFLLVLTQKSISQAGSMDPSFGSQGLVRTNIIAFKVGGDCEKVIPLSDGSFYVVIQVNSAAYVVHRLQNGELDNGYGTNGHSQPIFLTAFTAAIQYDGKIVLGGTVFTNSGKNDFCLARLNTNGKLDSSFAGDGMLNTDFFSRDDRIQGLAVQSDGKIVAAGYCTATTPGVVFAVARYNLDGSLDFSFSGDGKQTADFEGGSAIISSVAIQADGKIVTAGFAYLDPSARMAIARFESNGNLDLNFGIGGKATIYEGIGPMVCVTMALQSDGKAVLTGYGSAPNHFHEDVAIARLKTNGTRDSSFAGTGVRFADMGTVDNDARDLAIQNDGRIIVGGTTRINSEPPLYALIRFLPNGNTDNSYSDDGIQLTRISPLVDFLTTMALQPDGKLIAAGWSVINNNRLYSVARYNIDGNLDIGFDGDGMLTDGIPFGGTHFYSSVVQPDGKLIAVGSANADFVIVRYNIDGSLDSSFSNDGQLTVDFNAGADQASGVQLQPDGKIVVGGTADNGTNNDFAIIRLNTDGSIDNSFSGDGKLLVDFNGRSESGNSLTIQTDGKILVGGTSSSSSDIFTAMSVDFAICRVNPQGTIDNSFATNGMLLTDFGYAEFANAIMLQSDGKIVAAGSMRTDFYSAFGADFALARYYPDGRLDSTFGGTGKFTTDFFNGGDFAYGATLQSDGKIIVVGTSSTYPTYVEDIIVARYLPNGSLDNNFSSDGLLTLNMGSTTEQARSVMVQPNGKIILGIASDNVAYDFQLARLHPDGSFDNSFSGDGSVLVDFGFGFDYLENISITNERVYAVGSSDYVGTNGAVAAFIIDNTITYSLTCPTNKVTNTDPWICSAIVNNIDPNIVPTGTAVTYSLTGATNITGNGSASGLRFEPGITNVRYRLVNDPTITCQFYVTVNDNELPRAEYPFLQNICYNNSQNYVLPALQIMDNCGLNRVDFKISGATFRNGTGTNASGFLNVGTNAIDWTVTDNAGNSINLYSLVKVDAPINVTIPDAFSLSQGVDANTIYKGYSPAENITLHALPIGGTGYYATEWSDGFRAPWNTVHPAVQTTYTVTVTDLAGCSASASKTINVIDVRCGDQNNKVVVCKPDRNVVCIDFWTAADHLANGSTLGNCNEELLTRIFPSKSETENNNGILVYPNPSQHEFRISLRTGKTQLSELIIRDQIGRVVERIWIKSNQTVTVGSSYQPGFYFAEVIQGSSKFTRKLIKQ